MAEEKKDSKVVEVKSAAKKVEKRSKEKKAEKKDEAKKAKAKVVPTTARAISKNVRVTPRKVRLIIDLIRNKKVSVALGILNNLNKMGKTEVIKVVKSAAANAVNNYSFNENKLYIKEIYATDGTKIKRYLPRAKGSASGLVKRCANITCVVEER